MTVKSLSHSSLEDNRFYRSMLVGNTPFEPYIAAFELLETQVLTSSAATVSFTGLGSYTDYKHLQLRAVVRSTRNATTFSYGYIKFNSSGFPDYAGHQLFGNGSSVQSASRLAPGWGNGVWIDLGYPAANFTADSYGAMVIDILDFSDSNKNTTVRSLMGYTGSTNSVALTSDVWLSTDAITSITFDDINGDYDTGSRISLYGVKA